LECIVGIDCNGECGGAAVVDACGVCGGDGGLCDVCEGDAYFDNCGNCVGGNTGLIACVFDCNGNWGGVAIIDSCGICSGGLSNHVANSENLGCGCFQPGIADDGNNHNPNSHYLLHDWRGHLNIYHSYL
jgi:hypothetical protein